MLPTLDRGKSLLPDLRWLRPLPCRTKSPLPDDSGTTSVISAEPRTSAECLKRKRKKEMKVNVL